MGYALTVYSVADPERFNVEPEPTFYIEADPNFTLEVHQFPSTYFLFTNLDI